VVARLSAALAPVFVGAFLNAPDIVSSRLPSVACRDAARRADDWMHRAPTRSPGERLGARR
jgi:hypothetical protein